MMRAFERRYLMPKWDFIEGRDTRRTGLVEIVGVSYLLLFRSFHRSGFLIACVNLNGTIKSLEPINMAPSSTRNKCACYLIR